MTHIVLSRLVFITVFLQIITHPTLAIRHKAKLSPGYKLIWEVVDNEYVNFGAIVKTTGWVGLGLNNQPKMDGADLVILGVKDDKPYVFNYHGVGNMVVLEETSHWDMGYGRFFETDVETFVNFVRPLDTGDKNGLIIEDRDLYLLWAIGEDDDVNKKHISRGVVKINLLHPNETRSVPFE